MKAKLVWPRGWWSSSRAMTHRLNILPKREQAPHPQFLLSQWEWCESVQHRGWKGLSLAAPCSSHTVQYYLQKQSLSARQDHTHLAVVPTVWILH